jgi:hypothetical protein
MPSDRGSLEARNEEGRKPARAATVAARKGAKPDASATIARRNRSDLTKKP